MVIRAPSFGQWLRQRRKTLDLTQEALAQKVGCAAVTIYKIEADERRPSLQIAELIAEHLNIPAADRSEFVRFARGVAVPTLGAPWGTPFHPPTNLQAPPTLLIGRDNDLTALRKRLFSDGLRLLTLIGPPGIGKTRLALEIAAQVLDEFADGVFFVALAPIRDPAQVPLTISMALDLQAIGAETPFDRLKAHLRDRQVLLVLDNFEQVLAAANEVADLLSACPWLIILTTSRAPLRLRHERQFPISPLAIPNLNQQLDSETVAQSAAVTLFIDRAQAVLPDFNLTQENSRAVAGICVRVDGLPLAIELISARVKLMPPAALLNRLDGQLLLHSDGARDLDPRHRTLDSAIDWSYHLLDPQERALFRRLGIFVGGCTLEAVEAVCGMDAARVPFIVESLINSSLVQLMKGAYTKPRYEMLETIRAYALEKLTESGEAPLIQAAFTRFFLKFVEQAESELRTPDQSVWVQWLDDDYNNLRSVMKGLLQNGEHEALQHFGTTLTAFWHERGYLSEGRDWLVAALTGDESVSDVVQTAAVEALFSLVWAQGDYMGAELYAARHLALAQAIGDEQIIAAAYYSLGGVALAVGSYAEAQSYYEESRRHHSTPKKLWSTSFALTGIGEVAYLQGDFASARTAYREDLNRARETGSPQAISAALNGLAKIADMQGDFPTAQAYARESLSVAEKVANQQGMAIAQNRLGRIARQLGQYDEARVLHERSLGLARSIKNVPIIAMTMNRLGEIAADEGDYDSATRCYLEALPIHREMNDPYYIADNLCYLAEAALKMHQPSQAFIYMNEALALAWQIQAVVLTLQILTCYARWYVSEGSLTQAAELWGFLTGYSALLAQVARTVQALAPDLSPEAFRTAVEHGQSLALETIVNGLLQTLD